MKLLFNFLFQVAPEFLFKFVVIPALHETTRFVVVKDQSKLDSSSDRRSWIYRQPPLSSSLFPLSLFCPNPSSAYLHRWRSSNLNSFFTPTAHLVITERVDPTPCPSWKGRPKRSYESCCRSILRPSRELKGHPAHPASRRESKGTTMPYLNRLDLEWTVRPPQRRTNSFKDACDSELLLSPTRRLPTLRPPVRCPTLRCLDTRT